MGAELFRKYVSSTMIICYRSVVRHPFLIGMIIFLFSMYRLFPLLFSLLVSASPVLVSTAVLLGTLLSFGQPNIPEIDKESKSERDEIQKLESKVTSHTEIVGRDGSFASEETNGSRTEVAHKSFDDNSCVEADRPVNLVDDDVPQFGEAKNEIDEEKLVSGSHYSPLQQSEDEHIVLENDDKLWEGSADPLNSNSGLLWKRMEGNDDDDEDDDDGDDESDSGSDLAESSSPDASMADIIPMLDELHPLLSEEQETHEPPHMSPRDVTDAVSEHSLESSDTSSESNDDSGIENHEISKVKDDEGEDNKSNHINKEDDTRSAITWTEYDQKNLMNLGTSELERNRRLENLIARRRARKTMRMQAEKNLIDLESADLPWNIPPISTSRNNPFDYDSNDNIPGSAPSVMLQRRNPFDLPYDSSEEKPNLVGDTFQQEFAVFQPKEPFFRRHESFNVGPSIFGASRSERQESRLKPYFVPERSFSEFQRQFSGISDSKASSVPDTESVSSDLENKDQIEEDENSLEAEHVSEIGEHVSDHESHGRPYFVPEQVASDETSFNSFQRQLSEVSDSKVSSVPDTESVSSDGDLENKDHIDLSIEPDLISVEDHVHGSEIREQIEDCGNVNPTGPDEVEVTVGSMTNQQEIALDFPKTENAAGVYLISGDEGLHSSGSSLSSSDEASEQIYNEKEGDDDVAMTPVSETGDYFLDRGNSIERSEIDATSLLVEESQPNEPIYDLSPRSVTRNLSSSSISNDLHVQHTEDHNHSSSSVADVKLNSTESSLETRDGQNQLPAIPDNEERLWVGDDMSISLSNKANLETDDVVLNLDADHELEQVQVSSSDSHARSNESFHQEDVISEPQELSLLGRSEELQAHELEQGEVASLNDEARFTEVVHGETCENRGEDISQPQKQLPLIETSMNKSSEENPEILQVQMISNNSDNLQIQGSGVIEVTDIESKTPESHAYASETHSIESNSDDVDEIKEIDEDLLVELDAVGDFSVNDLGSALNEMREDPHASEHDLESKGIADEEDSYSQDLGTTLDEMKQDPHVSDHLETKHFEDEDSYSKDLGTTLDEIKQDPRVLDRDLETKISGDEDSYSKDETLDGMEQGPHDLETNHCVDEDSYSMDLDTPFNEMKQEPHRLETFYSVDENFYSKHVESTLNEMKQDPQAFDHDLEINIKMDAEVVKSSQNKNDISNTEVECVFQAEASKSKLTSDVNDTQETESTTSLTNSTSATTVNHGTENASSTSNTDKE